MFKKHAKENEVLQKANEVLKLAESALMKAEALYAQIEYEKNLLIEVLKNFAESKPAKVEALQLGKDEPIKPLTLKALREEKGLSLREMANSIDCSKSIVSCWEQGITKPPYTKIVLLANFFGYTIPEIEKAVQATADENFFKGMLNVTSLQNSFDLKGLRKKYNYSQKEVAKELCVSSNAVSAWETGINRMTRPSMLMLSRLYDVTYEEVEMAAKKSYKGEY